MKYLRHIKHLIILKIVIPSVSKKCYQADISHTTSTKPTVRVNTKRQMSTVRPNLSKRSALVTLMFSKNTASVLKKSYWKINQDTYIMKILLNLSFAIYDLFLNFSLCM